MQWQTKADAKAKDKWETEGCLAKIGRIAARISVSVGNSNGAMFRHGG